jgi:hypothetical protein
LTSGSRLGWLFFTLFLLGSCVRLGGIERPIELPNNWREFDVASIARNFEREGMDIAYPRIDWRGDGPGFAEMELPIYPWTAAWLYRAFGEREVILRLLSYSFSLASLWVFIVLARRLLPPAGALGATFFFILGPLPNAVGRAVQPESLMFLTYLLAVLFFLRWLDAGGAWNYAAWAGFTTLTILAKTPAAHIGLFYFFLLLRAGGWRKLLTPPVLAFPIWTLTLPALWYVHAYGLWKVYGNSLGASNEDHFIGLDVLGSPRLWGGIALVEVLFVWAIFGLAVAAYGLIEDRHKRVVEVAGLWMLTVLLYCVLCGRTLAGLWAWYYHIVAVAPAALLFGHGVEALSRVRVRAGALWGVIAGSGVFVALAWALLGDRVRAVVPNYAPQIVGRHLELPVVMLLLALAAGSFLVIFPNATGPESGKPGWLYWAALACVCPSLYLAAEVSLQRSLFHEGAEMRTAARSLAALVPPGAKIVTAGGSCYGSGLHRFVASDAPYLFYWMDRKGFSLCREKQSVEALREYSRRGAEYFVAEKSAVETCEGFEQQLKQTFPLVSESGELSVYRIGP